MNKILTKEPVQRVQKALSSFDDNIKIEVLNKSARRAIDAANVLKCEVGAIVKSLMLKNDNFFLMCLISGDKRCSLNKIKKIFNLKDISMANAEDVKKITGFTIGGVSPIGILKKLDVLIDDKLKRFEIIYAAAGHPNTIFQIKFEDLKKITSGKIKDISE